MNSKVRDTLRIAIKEYSPRLTECVAVA